MNPVDIRVAPHEPWYKYGVAVLLFEIAVAIAVSAYSLYRSAYRCFELPNCVRATGLRSCH
jgi:hypothetical protein